MNRIQNKIKLVYIALFAIFSINLHSQSTVTSVPAKVQVTKAELRGTTPPVKDLIAKSLTSKIKKNNSKKDFKPPTNFVGRKRNEILNKNVEHQGPDALRQTEYNQSLVTEVEPTVNVMGLTVQSAPHDPTGDIGENHYVQAINATLIGVYDKEGNLITQFTGNSLWSSVGFSSFGDPIILYDQEVDRWLITEFAPLGVNRMLVAISETSDPIGAYDIYTFSTPSFPDYPKYAVWDNSYTVTTNENGSETLSTYFIDRNAMLAGEEDVTIQRITLPGNSNTEAGFFVAAPVDWTGHQAPNSDPMFMVLDDSAWGSADQDQVNLFSVNVDFLEPANTAVTLTSIVTSPFDSHPCSESSPGFACVPQNGVGGLDAIPEVIMQQPHYRNFGSHESIVYNHITDITDGDNVSGIRWTELRKTSGSDWSIYQEGTFGPDDGLHRFMGSICMDGNGNIALAYNVTSEDDYVGIRYTGRRASDPLGQMTVQEYNVIDGDGPISSGGRFGDYAHMSIDPIDDKTFWYTTEYASTIGGGDVDTRIVAFSFGRDTIDLSTVELSSPQNSPNLSEEEVTIRVANIGVDTQQVFQVGYIFDNGFEVIEDVDYVLYPDSSYIHTFTTKVTFDEAPATYDLKTFTSLATDQNINNDTLYSIIKKLATTDAALSEIQTFENIVCGESSDISITITNLGTEVLSSAQLEVSLNGELIDTFDWVGSLAFDDSATETYALTGLINGENIITAKVINPNGTQDQISENDTRDFVINAITNGVDILINITSDEYPEEITWELSDSTGTVLYSGGDYTLQNSLETRSICLDPTACYTFTISDIYGDGICCSYGEGNYTITDTEGNPLLSSDGDYGPGESNDFCAKFTCLLTADVDITNSTGSDDGTILITTINGNEPFEYSIDGGENFQNENIFENLAPETYTIIVRDGTNCEYTIEALVNLMSGNNNIDDLVSVNIFPNPTNSTFTIDINGLVNGSTFQFVELYNSVGQKLQTRSLTKYDDTYTGLISLASYPNGLFYIRIQDDNYNKLIKVTKGK